MTIKKLISDVKPIRDIIHETLRNAILDGKIRPGERIVEKEYADRFEISRTPVREAIRKLEIEGLVEYIPRKGVVAKEIDAMDIMEIYLIRRNLESLAIKYVIQNITPAQIRELEDIIFETEEAEQKGDIDSVFQLSKEFNKRLLKAGRMPRLTALINSLQESNERIRRISMSHEERRTGAVKEHKAILQTIKEKDLKKAETLITGHLKKSEETVLKAIGKEKTESL